MLLYGLWPGGSTADLQGRIRWRLAAAFKLLPLLFGNNIPGHFTREPQVEFELATNSIQFYAMFLP